MAMNLKRSLFRPCELITSSVDSALQTMAFTNYFKVGDQAKIVSKDAEGCVVSVLAASLTVDAVTQSSLAFNTTVDTSTALPAGAVGWYVIATTIDDGQEAIDRLYRCYTGNKSVIQICVNADSPSELDTPIGGQSRHLVDDLSCFRVGDAVAVTCDNGQVGTANIVTLELNADEANNKSAIVLDANIDTSGETNCQICSTGLTVIDLFNRIKENIDAIDQPCINEYIGDGNCNDTVHDSDALFLQGTSDLYLDGRKLRLGTAGTRATHVEAGVANAELTFTSMILGLLGNEVEIEVVNAPGLAVTVTKSFAWNSGTGFVSSQYLIQIDSNSGAATSQEIADALNADAEVQQIMQVQFEGDGTGIVVPFGPSNLLGGLDDGIGDYAELPQLFNNEISLTGYMHFSMHIRPNEEKRLSEPVADTEELVTGYRKALTNA